MGRPSQSAPGGNAATRGPMSDHDDSRRYSMILEWEPKGRVYVVTVPELPGCPTHGTTLAEAVRHGLEATEGCIEAARAWGEAVPPPKHFVLDPVDEAALSDHEVDASAENRNDPDEPFDSATEGGHRFWRHPLLPGEYVTIAGDDEDDALPYQEQDVRRMIARAAALGRERHTLSPNSSTE